MKTFILCSLGVSQVSGFAQPQSSDHYAQKFAEWKAKHGKSYDTAEAEAKALSVFTENDDKIESHNAKGLNYWMGHNEFSDMTADEFQMGYISGLKGARPNKAIQIKTGKLDLPDAVDWVAQGAVTPVKNQGQCGSCWSFSTTGSMEGAYQIAEGELLSFSEEDLVQCDKVDSGCNGGLMDNAFRWIKQEGGVALESAYPYTSGTGTRGTCNTAKEAAYVATCTGFQDVPSQDEEALKEAVAKTPVSVAIEADKSVFQLYKGGVLDSTSCGTKLDHGVLVVGYGTDGTDYWKVKNSWGATWGEEGYIRLARGVNQCGVAMQPSYPTGVKKVAPGPAPGPSPPPSPTETHYGDPASGCESDEIPIQVQGLTGDFCSPKCQAGDTCPTDVPSGVTASPECALSSASSSDKYCALICSPSLPIVDLRAADAQCGTNASCKPIQGVGICTYND